MACLRRHFHGASVCFHYHRHKRLGYAAWNPLSIQAGYLLCSFKECSLSSKLWSLRLTFLQAECSSSGPPSIVSTVVTCILMFNVFMRQFLSVLFMFVKLFFSQSQISPFFFLQQECFCKWNVIQGVWETELQLTFGTRICNRRKLKFKPWLQVQSYHLHGAFGVCLHILCRFGGLVR